MASSLFSWFVEAELIDMGNTLRSVIHPRRRTLVTKTVYYAPGVLKSSITNSPGGAKERVA
jgi:hypothetical protein